VAVIGAGQTGVTAALGLLDNGFAVTIYCDRELAEFGNLFFTAANSSDRFASKLFTLLDDPKPFEAVTSVATARELIADYAGEPADAVLDRFAPAGRSIAPS
jgi:glycine/D-amino acid oxidase-like deaminating enzyme